HTSSDVFIDRLAPEGMRGAYFGAKSFNNLGQFIGPWLGGILMATYGGSSMFMVIAIITMCSNIFFWSGQRAYCRQTGKSLE
ncbi:hypothetical protein MXD81_25475, partial [Microbacteriaceae bacterium K1510]|nr:hypothetical protein [Microbacteriaceae bacterium K1510]